MALHFSKEEFSKRKSKVLNSMKEQNLDAILMFRQESMYWLTGYDTFGYVFFQSLKDINAKLWVIEDDKRQCEKDKDFGEKFIKLSRDVHFLNDDRAKIKLEINNHTGSTIKEIKEYTSY